MRLSPPPGSITVLEHPLHIQPVGGTRLVIGAALQVVGQLPGTAVVNHPGVRGTDSIYEGKGGGGHHQREASACPAGSTGDRQESSVRCLALSLLPQRKAANGQG